LSRLRRCHSATFKSGVQFARTEGIVPAPEANHGIKVAIDEALAAKSLAKARPFDSLERAWSLRLAAYDEYLSAGFRIMLILRPR